MARNEDSFKKGERAYYFEGGDVFDVTILKNNSDEDKIGYDLKILGVDMKDPKHKPPKSGIVFECWKTRKGGAYGLWSLRERT